MPATAQMGARPKVGQNSSIGASAVQLVAAPSAGVQNIQRGNAGVIVKALPGNTATVYVGGDATVTSSTGFPLAAGDAITLPVDDPSRVYAVAASGTQALAWISV